MSSRAKQSICKSRALKDAPLAIGLKAIIASATKIGHNWGIEVSCDHCNIAFRKAASHAKRTAHNYCGHGCASAARRKRMETTCCICGTALEVTPSDSVKYKTCSKPCEVERKKRLAGLKRPNR
jgi:hypothetical protein